MNQPQQPGLELIQPKAQALALPQAGQPQAGVGPQAQAQGHCSFTSLFQDEMQDPFRASWAQVLRYFDDAATDASAIMTAALGNVNASSAYLCCVTLYPKGSPKVYVLHTLSRYPPTALDGTVTPWDDQLFGCLGDQVQDTIVTVMISPTAFAVTPDARVYTMNAIEGHVAQLPEQDLFQRIAQAGNEVEQLRTRALMYSPSRFALLLLNNNRGLTPKAAYASLLQAIASEQQGNLGNADDIQPILDWLRLTLHATGNDNAGPPVTSAALTIPVMDEDLTAHRSPIV